MQSRGGGSSLTSFEVGQTISGIEIDPNAKTSAEIDAWLEQLLPNEGNEIVFQVSYQYQGSGDSVAVKCSCGDMDFLSGNLYRMIEIHSSEKDDVGGKYIYYYPEINDTVDGEVIHLDAGFYNDDFEPIESIVTLQLRTGVQSVELTNENTTIAQEFSFLNGICIGAILAE